MKFLVAEYWLNYQLLILYSIIDKFGCQNQLDYLKFSQQIFVFYNEVEKKLFEMLIYFGMTLEDWKPSK